MDAHGIASELGLRIEIHPPTKNTMRAFCEGASEVHPPEPFLQRNKKIVDTTKILVAAPESPVEEIRSGTWSTVRYARKQEARDVVVIKPDGKW